MPKYKIDPKKPWTDTRQCNLIPAGCRLHLCQDLPKHNLCNHKKINEKFQPQIDEANAKLSQANAKLAAEQQCSSIQNQISSYKAALADCKAKKSSCEQSKQEGAGKKIYKKKDKNQKGGKAETPGQLTKRLRTELAAINAKIDEANAKLAAGATCSANLNSLNTELTSIKTALEACDLSRKAACETPKPVNNDAFNLNTRADLSHIRGAGRKVYGTYQRGEKKGKLKKGFKFVNGVAVRV